MSISYAAIRLATQIQPAVLSFNWKSTLRCNVWCAGICETQCIIFWSFVSSRPVTVIWRFDLKISTPATPVAGSIHIFFFVSALFCFPVILTRTGPTDRRNPQCGLSGRPHNKDLPIDTTNDDDFLLMMMLAADYEQFHYCDYPSLNIKNSMMSSYTKKLCKSPSSFNFIRETVWWRCWCANIMAIWNNKLITFWFHVASLNLMRRRSLEE